MNDSNNIMNKVTGYIQYKHISDVILDIKHLDYAIIKGCPLSYYAYSDYGRRSFLDTDILIDRKDISALEKVMLDHGFGQEFIDNKPVKAERGKRILCLSNSHQILPYYRRVNNQLICFDVNFDIFWGEYTEKRINISKFLSDLTELEFFGVKIKTLRPLQMMIQLILHHYKDMNSIFLLATRKSIKYSMFKDVYYLLKNNIREISVERLYAISKEYNIIPYVYYIFYYTSVLFEDDIFKDYIGAFKTQEGDNLLNCYGLNDSERREWKYDFNVRLESESLYSLIKDDLTDKDIEKIALNKVVFCGE